MLAWQLYLEGPQDLDRNSVWGAVFLCKPVWAMQWAPCLSVWRSISLSRSRASQVSSCVLVQEPPLPAAAATKWHTQNLTPLDGPWPDQNSTAFAGHNPQVARREGGEKCGMRVRDGELRAAVGKGRRFGRGRGCVLGGGGRGAQDLK